MEVFQLILGQGGAVIKLGHCHFTAIDEVQIKAMIIKGC